MRYVVLTIMLGLAAPTTGCAFDPGGEPMADPNDDPADPADDPSPDVDAGVPLDATTVVEPPDAAREPDADLPDDPDDPDDDHSGPGGGDAH